MKNKAMLKKYIFFTFFLILFNIFFSLCFQYINYQVYQKNYNQKVESILSYMKKKYPNVTKNELVSILNSEDETSGLLREYGIHIATDASILKNEEAYTNFQIIQILLTLAFSLSFLFVFLHYNHRKDKELNKILNYVEQINRSNYEIKIDDNTEDELSILKNEVYKVMIKLKEAALHANADKVSLKNTLADISHQLKTPLTSILITLDNLIENPDMEESLRQKFIFSIKREITNINELVQNLLKLSKFDANTIEFKNREELVSYIIDEAIQNVATLCDLKNIQIKREGSSSIKFSCDALWQIEAISNILKNAIEYSKDNSVIEIRYKQNKMYTLIQIQDYGIGIPQDEIKHIFKRFYKSSNSTSESVGIGLNLAKNIIEKNKGSILVSSQENKGTLFTIKYYKEK